jgi:TatD DNase family protein
MLETDSPYMPPVPHRGSTNRPAYIPLINKVLADLHNMSEEEMASQTTQNATDFFKF